ncbi:unnamed protein product [Parascedosporium putredinis]|uniref:Uncharacterized protein n=1 Tax=Parascedosporium putredinis TaxID=1442378 RepID=A0A9P1MGV1_9PEZI|nr:unnamed protein product [Parascedosporium putredinis]CAI8005120.1 unnamed protein product [Parascedosporium putredinis]
MAATRATTEDGGTSATEKPKVGRGRPRTAPKRPTIQEPASKADGGSDGDGDGDGESAKLEDLTAALSDSRAENKSLSTKLAVSRSAEATLAKVPGSAVKSQGQARGTVNSDIIQAAQMKEDLYSDLTGLIVRG